ncbi:Dicer-like protein 1 [Dissophora ornata]|nr:Dicer-like protein 1 [Dissophora ornata]
MQCNLIIFDECHHAIGNHCYRQIMTTFYAGADKDCRPKIFGMTASPPKDKGNKSFSAMELERTLDAQIITASYNEVLQFTQKPRERVVRYNQLEELSTTDLYCAQEEALQQLKALCESDPKFKTVLGAFEYAQLALGPWCATRIWKYALRGLRDDFLNGVGPHVKERLQQLDKAETIAKKIQDAPLDSSLSTVREKLKKVVEILQEQRESAGGFCAIIFVERRPVAHVLHEFLLECKQLGPEIGLDFIKAAVLTGHGSKGDISQHRMQLKEQRRILDGFRRGHINLLVSTDVAEEGLDIDRCRLVIRFDIKNTLISHIQSRGRARDPVSEYIIMQPVEDADHLDAIKAKENEMRQWCGNLPEDRVINLGGNDSDSSGNDSDPSGLEQMRELADVETIYVVESTGARMSFHSAVALLHQYCASLPSDAYTQLQPYFEVKPTVVPGEFECRVTLPPNAPVSEFNSGRFSKKSRAKNAAAFLACKKLHLLGALSDRLLPHRNKVLVDGDLMEEEFEEEEEGEADDASKSRSKKSMKSFPINQPKFWDNKIVAPTVVSEVESRVGCTRLHMTIFTLHLNPPADHEQLDVEGAGSDFRSLCLLTSQVLPKFDPIQLFFDEGSRWVKMTSIDQPMDLTAQQLEDLHRYCKLLYLNLYRKPVEMGSVKDGMPHIIAPIKSKADLLAQSGSTPDQFIDWEEVKAGAITTNAVDITESDLLWDRLKDRLLIEKGQMGRLYFTRALRTDLTPSSPIPDGIKGSRELGQGGKTFAEYYRETRDTTIFNLNQPLVEVSRAPGVEDLLQPNKNNTRAQKATAARFLVPELGLMCPVAASVFRSGSWMVSALNRLDGLLLTIDFTSELKLPISTPLALEALTTSELAHAINYQRLELLGDTFLKFLTTLDLYTRHLFLDEGQLSMRRTAMVNNKKLYYHARRLRMDRFIIALRNVNPHFFAPSTSSETPNTPGRRLISHKTMADLIESTLGAAYFSGGLDLGFEAAVALLGPIDGVNRWEDFGHTYYDRIHASNPNPRQFVPLPVFGDLSNVERSIGYKFTDLKLLAEALTHATSLRSQTQCYQRLEFLGDAILDMLVAKHWVEVYPVSGPGKIHSLKSASINNQILGVICIQLGLHQHIHHMSSALCNDINRAVEKLNDAMEDAKGSPSGELEGEFWEDFNYTKVLGDVLESVLGAVYVDSRFDFSVVQRVFDNCMLPVLQKHLSMETLKGHPVSVLVMRVQQDGCQLLTLQNITEQTTVELKSTPASPTSFTESDSFWSNSKSGPVSNPVQEYAVFIHEQVIASVTSTQVQVARKEVAKKVLELMDRDPGMVARYCDCASRVSKRARSPESSPSPEA